MTHEQAMEQAAAYVAIRKWDNEYQAILRVGVQTFGIGTVETAETAQWWRDMLQKAIANIIGREVNAAEERCANTALWAGRNLLARLVAIQAEQDRMTDGDEEP